MAVQMKYLHVDKNNIVIVNKIVQNTDNGMQQNDDIKNKTQQQ